LSALPLDNKTISYQHESTTTLVRLLFSFGQLFQLSNLENVRQFDPSDMVPDADQATDQAAKDEDEAE